MWSNKLFRAECFCATQFLTAIFEIIKDAFDFYRTLEFELNFDNCLKRTVVFENLGKEEWEIRAEANDFFQFWLTLHLSNVQVMDCLLFMNGSYE